MNLNSWFYVYRQTIFLKKGEKSTCSQAPEERGGIRCWRQSSVKCTLDTWKRHFPLQGWEWMHIIRKDGRGTGYCREQSSYMWIWPRHVLNIMNEEIKCYVTEWSLDFNWWCRFLFSYSYLIACVGWGASPKIAKPCGSSYESIYRL